MNFLNYRTITFITCKKYKNAKKKKKNRNENVPNFCLYQIIVCQHKDIKGCVLYVFIFYQKEAFQEL